MATIRNSNDLLHYIRERAESGDKAWFSWIEQRITGIPLAHHIAANHADKMTPEQVVEYVVKLNSLIHQRIAIGK